MKTGATEPSVKLVHRAGNETSQSFQSACSAPHLVESTIKNLCANLAPS